MTDIVRPATIDDRFEIIRLGRQFLLASGLPIPFSAAYAEATVRRAIEDSERLALVLDRGGVKGVLIAAAGIHDFAPIKVASELMWWIDPTCRGGGCVMLDAYERWASDRGCDLIGLAARDDRPAALYARRGYRPVESHFVKLVG